MNCTRAVRLCPDCGGPRTRGAQRCRACASRAQSVQGRARCASMTIDQRRHVARGLIRRNLEAPTQRRYTLNEHFFDVIDTEGKAYWLGFIAADGNISGGNLQFGLADKDGDHLEVLIHALDGTHKVRREMRTTRFGTFPVAHLSIASRLLVAGLVGQGITPRKSLTCHAWEGPSDLQRHYWRGVIDGDGSVGDDGISLVGSEAMIRAFAAFMAEQCQTKAQPRSHKGIWRAAVSGRVQAARFAAALYAGSTVALERKRQAAERLMASKGGVISGTARYSDAWKAHLSAVAKERGIGPGLANRLAHGTPEARERARQRALGRKMSAETRERMSASQRLRYEHG